MTLRSFFVTLAISSFLIITITVAIARSRYLRFRQFVAAVEDKNGEVQLQYSFSPSIAEWIEDHCGPDYALWMKTKVQSVLIRDGNGEIGDDWIDLSFIGDIEGLELHQTRITDAGLQKLSSIPSLRRVVIESDHITDLGVEALLSMPRLQGTHITSTQITGKVLRGTLSTSSIKLVVFENSRITKEEISEYDKDHPSLNVHLIGPASDRPCQQAVGQPTAPHVY